MELFIIILIGLLLLLGIIGSIVPGLPGPPLAFTGLLLYHLLVDPMLIEVIIWIGILVTIVTFLDYWLQIYGVKKAGGGKYAIRGSIIGILLGIFLFPPFGILVGAFIGAFIGAKADMKTKPKEKDSNEIKIAFGAVLGFIAGTILKVSTSVYIIYIILF